MMQKKRKEALNIAIYGGGGEYGVLLNLLSSVSISIICT